jgi:Arc/MetJ family transcription regulator
MRTNIEIDDALTAASPEGDRTCNQEADGSRTGTAFVDQAATAA